MRINRWVLLASAIIGLAGAWSLFTAFRDYVDTVNSFTEVDLQYVKGSFSWADPEFERGSAKVEIFNDSGHDVTVTHFSIFLEFDGEFAGTDYRTWDDLAIPAGESRVVTAEFQVTATRRQDQGGTADLGLHGSMWLEFEEIEEPLSISFAGTIGQVGWEGG